MQNKSNACILLACGPSLLQQDLNALAQNPCVAISNFFVHELYPILNIEYHVFGARHEPISEKMYVNWFRDAQKHIPKETKVLVNENERELAQVNNLFQKQTLEYWTFSSSKHKKFQDAIPRTLKPLFKINGLHRRYVKDLPHTIQPCKGVAAIGLQICLHCAIKNNSTKIILLGVDHSWGKHIGESRHFYEESQHSLVRDGYDEWFQKPSNTQEKENLMNIEKFYRNFSKISNYFGIKVYNGTPNSMISCLPFIDINNEK
jgi:hypothetical protein